MATPVMKIGPCGGPGDSSWELEGIDHLIEIRIWGDDVIRAISFQYYDSDGSPRHSRTYGGISEGEPSHKISLRRDEILSTITGTCIEHDSENVVKSLLITTNQRTHYRIGVPEGMEFSLPTVGGTVVGFHGNQGKYLNAIGLLLKSPESPGMATTVKMGPCGGYGGSSWQFQGISRLTQIQIWHGIVIDAVSFQYYDSRGLLQQSPRLGGTGGNESLITLDEEEIITSIAGYWNEYNDFYVVNSLLITTNRGSYGPYGTQSGLDFSLPTKGRTIIGFHGRYGLYLDAIGVLFNI